MLFVPFVAKSIYVDYACRRELSIAEKPLITGPNGSGKSSVYRALRLLADTAQGGVIPSLAREGGLQSTLWAVLVVTHAPKLIEALEEQDDCNSVRLEKEFGETKIVGAGTLDLPVKHSLKRQRHSDD